MELDKFGYVTTAGFDDTLNLVLYVIAHPFLMMVWGIVLHFLASGIERAKNAGRMPTADDVVPGWIQMSFSVISALIGYAILMPSAAGMGVISDDVLLLMRGLGFTIGYSCDSIAEKIVAKNEGGKP